MINPLRKIIRKSHQSMIKFYLFMQQTEPVIIQPSIKQKETNKKIKSGLIPLLILQKLNQINNNIWSYSSSKMIKKSKRNKKMSSKPLTKKSNNYIPYILNPISVINNLSVKVNLVMKDFLNAKSIVFNKNIKLISLVLNNRN